MKFSVKINLDSEGYTGRECPTCEKYFKIKFGTGLPDATECHCPYCNHVGPQDHFWTKQQLEYAESVAINKITGQLLSQMKKMERRPDPRALISIGISVKGSPTPIAYYSESELEERITCGSCALEYTIYGAFAFCPDCGIHNSLQIAKANLELVIKTLDFAMSADPGIASRLIENALEDAVSCFDGFGREHCTRLPYKISFQNIEGAKEKLFKESGYDLVSGMSLTDWQFIREQFQKRHLFAHKMGIIDSEYVSKTGGSTLMVGRKVPVSDKDVRRLVALLLEMAEKLYQNVVRG